MLEKFSVKKPFTVLVGVILIIVLGVMSVINTSTDLFPNIDLPFTAVFTTYIGAVPEQVEMNVSIPKEEALGTLSGIQNIQSISNEHVSIVILEFADGTNMDTAFLEIRESLDMINFPQGVQRPSIMRINPELMPIMMASLYMEGMGIDELSEFALDYIAPALEAIPGVAVVNLGGLVQNQLHVILRQELIDTAMNDVAQGLMAVMMAQMEELIEGQVALFSQERMAELMAEGLSLEEAGAQVQAELPFVIESITEELV